MLHLLRLSLRSTIHVGKIARQSKGGPGKSVARRRSRSASRGARARSVSPTRAKESEEDLNRARLREATKVPSPLHEEKEPWWPQATVHD